MEAASGAVANMYDIAKSNKLSSLEEACRLSAEVHIRIGAQLYSAGQSSEAREPLARARVLADEGRQAFASLSFYAGLVEETLGDIPAAIAHLESFMQTSTKVLHLPRCHLADACINPSTQHLPPSFAARSCVHRMNRCFTPPVWS